MQQKRVLVLLNFSYYQFTLSSSVLQVSPVYLLCILHVSFYAFLKLLCE